MDSILDSIKKNLGIPLEETHFDGELIININSNISVLKQLGVGTPSFVVYDNSDLWSEFVDKETHDYIHFGKQTINKMPIQRSRNDHCPWLH